MTTSPPGSSNLHAVRCESPNGHLKKFIVVAQVAFLLTNLLCHSAFAQLAGYSFRKQITIDNTKVSGTADLTDFPILFSVTDAALASVPNDGNVQSANGYDIAFTASDGTTVLDHEIDSYDPATGTLIAWIRIPTLSYNVDTDIYMYYGALVSADPSATGTWDSNFKGVWHLDEDMTDEATTGQHDDATSYGFDGDQRGNVEIAAKIGNGQDFDGDDYIGIGNPLDGAATGTISAWIRHDALTAVRERYVSLGSAMFIRHNGTSSIGQLQFGVRIGGTYQSLNMNGVLSASTWHYVTGTWDGTTQRVYLDGVEIGSQTPAGTMDASTGSSITSGGDPIDGIIDEARVSNIARSADWIATEYANQNDPSSFHTTGSEELAQAPGNISSNLAVWLKADHGAFNGNSRASDGTDLNTWQDLSLVRSNHATDQDFFYGPPTFRNNSSDNINFNPVVDFNGSNDGLDYFGDYVYSSGTGMTWFAIVEPDDAVSTKTRQFVFDFGTFGDEGYGFFYGDEEFGQYTPGLHGGATHNTTHTRGTESTMASIVIDFGNQQDVYLDGAATATLSTAITTSQLTLAEIDVWPTTSSFGGPFALGVQSWYTNRSNDNGRFLDGSIAEVIGYAGVLTATERKQVESYLGIKYGLTLDNTGGGTNGDYIASDGTTTLWDASANSAYHNDVAGIGRDDAAGLDQQKSLGANSDAMIIMDKGASFSNDRDYILWGNNDGALTTSTSGASPDFVNILQRTWKAAVTGSPGTVTLRVIYTNSGTATDYGLHLDSDGDFTSGATTYTGSSVSGDTITFENVTISDGDYFTMGYVALQGPGPRGPGGVGDTDGTTNLTLWLDAGSLGSGSVATWEDLSGYGNNAVQVGNAPTYTSSWGGNGLPAVAFDDTNNEYLSVTGNSEVKPTGALSVFIAGNFDSSSDTYGSLINTASNNLWEDGWGIGLESTTALQYFTDWNDPYGQTRLSLNAGVDDQKHIYGLVHASGTSTAYEDESSGTFSPSTLTYQNPNDEILIGAGPDNAGAAYFMTGEIGEMILYDVDLNVPQRIILNNYLSAKYDIALSANDLYSQDDNVNGDFDFHVAGIGRVDPNSHDDSQGSGIVRIFNPTNLDNNEFLLWGYDNGTVEATETADVPAGVDSRLVAQWRVSEVNTSAAAVDVGSVDMVFDLDGLGSITASDLVLLVDTDNDGTFADETTITGASHQGQTYYLFTGVSALADGYRFTVGTSDRTQTPLISAASGSDGPGGVGSTDGISELKLWLDASTITGIADGLDITGWLDLSGYGHDVTLGTAPNYSATGGGNSQPAVTFDGSNNESLSVAGNADILPTDELSVFVAGNYEPGTSDSWAGLVSTADDAGRNDGWGISEDNATGNMAFWLDDVATTRTTQAITSGTDEVWSVIFNTTDNLGYGYKSESGGSFAFAGPLSYDAGRNDDLLIGSLPNNSGSPFYYMSGDISEIIEFNVAINDAQRIIISNYLAAKYGVTLSANDVYDEDAGGYDFEVAGIGQATGGDNHTDAKGTGIIRILAPAALDDGDFLMWGHDNGALTATETTDIPTGIDARLARVWRASETADVGAIDMVWDLTDIGADDALNVRLLVDTDNDGFFNDETPISGASLLSGNSFIFPGVTAIEDNVRFTIGVIQLAPGNVLADLEVWLRSDQGTQGGATLTGWQDQSANTNDATASGDLQYMGAAINYNPAIDFDGTGDYLSTTTTSIIGNDGNYTKYAVIVPHDLSTTRSIVASDASGNHDLRQTSAGLLQPRHNSIGINNIGGMVENQVHIVGVRYSGTNNYTIVDGRSVLTTGTVSFTDGGSIEIGGRNSGTGLFDGYIAETVVYNAAKSDGAADQIESYLAMKYGITLDNSGGGTEGDYLASNGTTIWDADLNAAYHNDVIAIGRDDNSALYQRQSRTQDDSLRVYIDALAGDNSTNSGSISNDVSFLVIGHNGGLLMSDGSVDSEAPAGITSRMVREWKITNTNFTDQFSLEFEWKEVGTFNIADVRLLVDADGDFSNATIYGPADGLTFTEGSIIVGGLTSTHIPGGTSYVTLASTSAGTPLPIDLMSFDAQVVDDERAVKLDWSTASETDNDFFAVERSYNNVDWKPILILPGAGTSSEMIEYQAFDEDPLFGLSYYRLKQTDFDGKYTYSDLRQITIGEFEKQMTVYPNPTEGELFVKGDPEELATIEVVFLSGQRVQEGLVIRRVSPTEMRLDVSSLPTGIYTLRTRSRSWRFIKR